MTDLIRIGALADFQDGELHAVNAGGRSLVVGLVDGAPCAASSRCPHLGLSLAKGPGGKRFADGQVVCPWHNSRFDLRTGENLDWAPGFAGRAMPRWSARLIAMGRKPASLTTYPVVVEGEDVLVDLSPTSDSAPLVDEP
jgi:nitrite reductase/ring-hydroxylating ferredoxin subunit